MDERNAATPSLEIVSTPGAMSPAHGQNVFAAVVLRTWRNMAVQDHVMLAYHVYLMLRGLAAADGPRLALALPGTFILITVVTGTLLSTRGGLLAPGPTRAIAYRVGMFGSMAGSYFTLGPLLKSLGPLRFDPALIAIDEFLFGATPSIVLDQFVTPLTVEWFAFFYYSYYTMMGLYLLPTLFFDKGARRYELLFAAGFIVAAGHSGYTLVPGVGPYAWPSLSFAHDLTGGIWFQRVHTAVASAGAMLDIFPSLHTALSVLLALHAVRYRKEIPFRWVWLPTVFIVINIVIATVFLRWHYAIDLVAGTLLASGAYMFGIRSWGSEQHRGGTDDRQEVWEAIPWRTFDASSLRWLVAIVVVQLGAVAAAATIAAGS